MSENKTVGSCNGSCEGSCPACRSGEVKDHKCDHCRREFCPECHGIKAGTASCEVAFCVCKSLEGLLERAKKLVMTTAENREQAISFAYGNIALHNPGISREMVEKIYDQLVLDRLIKP